MFHLVVFGLVSFTLTATVLPLRTVAAEVVDIIGANSGFRHFCNTTNGCYDKTLLCLNDEGNSNNCVIWCIESSSCLYAQIVVANSYGLEMHCEGMNSCLGAEVFWVNAGNLLDYRNQTDPPNNNVQIGGALTQLQCTATNACWGIAIHGETQGLGLDTVTQWMCDASNACNGAIANYSGSLLVQCPGSQSCTSFVLFCLNGANCEVADATSDIDVIGATMICAEDVNACVCGDFWNCYGTKTAAPTEEPLTSTEISSTELTTTVWTSTEQSTSHMPATTKPETSTDNPTNTEKSTEVTTSNVTTSKVTSTEMTTKESMTSTTAHFTMMNSTIENTRVESTKTTTTESDDSGKHGGDWLSNHVVLVGVAIGGTLLLVLCVICGCIWKRDKGGTKKRVEEEVDVGSELEKCYTIELGRRTNASAEGVEEFIGYAPKRSRAEGVPKETVGGEDIVEKQQLDAALRKVDKFQRDENDARFGQMLGDLNLGNAILQEDVVEDMAVVGETLGYDESQSEARAEGIAVDGGPAIGSHEYSEERVAKAVHFEVDKSQGDCEFVQTLGSTSDLMQEDAFYGIDGVTPTSQ